MFSISSCVLDPGALKSALADEQAGACVTFEGWVRSHNEGQPVVSLEYEAYLPLAEAEGTRILAEAREKYAIVTCSACHRVGHLRLGDLAVWVGVTAEHRNVAFEACRYIIDEAKARLPVWKKEHYASGTSTWINCGVRGNPGSADLRPPK